MPKKPTIREELERLTAQVTALQCDVAKLTEAIYVDPIESYDDLSYYDLEDIM